MDMTVRTKKILSIMLEEDKVISVTKLAEKLKVSKRTVQRELEYLPTDLAYYNLKFASKTGSGVWIEGDENDKHILYNILKNESFVDENDKEQRQKKILFEILKDKDVKKLFWYSNKFKVSEATISTDLESIEPWLNNFHLYITKKPGSGIMVEGSERDYRKAIRTFISENISYDILNDMYNRSESNFNVINNLKNFGILNMAGQNTVSRVIECLNAVDSEQIKSLTENAYMALVMHVSIAIMRILGGEIIESLSLGSEKYLSDKDFVLADKIAFELSEEFEINIPKQEINYISLHIKVSKSNKINADNIVIDGVDINSIIDELIYEFDSENAYLIKQDEDFISGITTHLSPTIIRLLSGMKIQNPMLSEIKSQYSDVYKKCKKASVVFEKYLDKKIPDDEIAFLTIHFAAAMVRIDANLEKTRIVNIGIICSSGIGISRLIEIKLKKIFKLRVNLTAYSRSSVSDEVIQKEDFFISTFVTSVNGKDVLHVNPLLKQNDLDNIRDLIVHYERTTKKNREKNIALDLEQISFFATQMRSLANEMQIYNFDENIGFENAVTEIVNKIAIQSDEKDLIINDILEREKIATQVFPEVKFALLHARTSGVSVPSFNIFTTENRTSFKDEYFKNIKVIFAMLIPIDENEKVNGEILGCISSSLVESTLLMDTILNGNDSDVKNHITSTLKSFFAEYLIKMSE